MKDAAEIFEKYAHSYDVKYANVSQYAPQLDTFIANLDRPDSAILDVACGPANLSNYIAEKKPHVNIDGIDLSPTMLEIARSKLPKANFTLLDCRNIAEMDSIYDGIVLGFAIPYLNESETAALLLDCYRSLHAKGVLYVSITLGNYRDSEPQVNSFGDALMMYFYDEVHIAKMWTAAGFEALKIQRLDLVSERGTYAELIAVLKKR